MMCYCQIRVNVLFGDGFPNKNQNFLRKVDKQRVSLKLQGIQPEG